MNVLFVCTGNINRSAAAVILAQKYSGWKVKGAALNLKSGRPMNRCMRDLLGLDLNDHRSTAISAELIEWADILVGFQPSHMKQLLQLSRGARPHKPVYNIVRWLDDGEIKVPDPQFDSTGQLHREVLRMLKVALPRMRKAFARPPQFW